MYTITSARAGRWELFIKSDTDAQPQDACEFGCYLYAPRDTGSFTMKDALPTAEIQLEKWREQFSCIADAKKLRDPAAVLTYAQKIVKPQECLARPLYKLDHSGTTYSTSSFPGQGWDSGQVGWIFAGRELLERETGRVWSEAVAEQEIQSYLRQYNAYLEYGFGGIVLHKDGKEVDSLWHVPLTGEWAADMEDVQFVFPCDAPSADLLAGLN